MRVHRSLVLLAAALVGLTVPSGAQGAVPARPGDYPDRPVQVIVAFGAGGGTDVAARTVFRAAERLSGAAFPVVNRPGASGELGWTAIATARPDGYTIGMVNPPAFVILPITRPTARYTIDSFDYIANIVRDPGTILVRADSPLKNMKDLVAAAKKANGAFSIAYSGPGTAEAVALEQLERSQGITLNKIPFDGTAPSLTALIGGNVDAMSANISELIGQIRQGQLRSLGVAATERIDMVPDVPTWREQGIDIQQVAYRGIAAPKGLPPERLEYLAQLIRAVVEDPEFRRQAAELSLPLHYLGPKEFREAIVQMRNTLQPALEKK